VTRRGRTGQAHEHARERASERASEQVDAGAMDEEAKSALSRRGMLSIAASYILDWITVAVLVAVYVAVDFTTVEARFFNITDPELAFPLRGNTVSTLMMIIIGFGVPLAISVIVEIIFAWRLGKSWNWQFDLHHATLGLIQTHAVGLLFTNCIKRFVGRVRPSGLVRKAEGDKDWNLSYVSGHTSFCFAGMTFLALYLSAKFGIFSDDGVFAALRRTKTSPRTDPYRGTFPAAVICLCLPIALSTYVGATRLTDYAHFFADVNGGAGVGVFAGIIGYHVVFPAVSVDHAHLCRPLARAARIKDDPTGIHEDTPNTSAIRQDMHEEAVIDAV